MNRGIFALIVCCLLLCQCNSLESDCRALAKREAEISREPVGDYFIGRRYYVPITRFWGYLRSPGQSWRTAKLVIMDESACRTPDRGVEPPDRNAVFGSDQNVEYKITGKYTGEQAYDPSTDQVLPVFKATGYSVLCKQPGFLFVPSERYDTGYVTLVPSIMPKPEHCAAIHPQS